MKNLTAISILKRAILLESEEIIVMKCEKKQLIQ